MARRGRKKKEMITRKIIFALLFVAASALLTAGVIWGYNKILLGADAVAPTFPATLGTNKQWSIVPKQSGGAITETYVTQSKILVYYTNSTDATQLEVWADINQGLSLAGFDQLSYSSQLAKAKTQSNVTVSECGSLVDGQNCFFVWSNSDPDNGNKPSDSVNFYVPVTKAVSGQNNGVIARIYYKITGKVDSFSADLQQVLKFIGNSTLPGPRSISAYMSNTATTAITDATSTAVTTTTPSTAASGLAPGPKLTENTAAGSQTTTSAAATIGVKIPGNDATSYTYKDYVKAVYNFSLRMGGVLVILMIIYAGYIYMTSQGDSAKLTSAKDIMFGSILGFVMLILLGVILQFVGLPTTETLKNTSDVTNSANKTTP